MKYRGREILGNEPFLYAQKVLRECGQREPPIDEKIILDYLGLEMTELPVHLAPPELRERLKRVDVWLESSNGVSHVYINPESNPKRRRMGVFHECGHAILPWHQGINYLCKEHDVNGRAHKTMEREAYQCAAELHMPGKGFRDDLMDMQTCMSAIRGLADRYAASLEAAAIRYADVHPGYCAVVMVEQARDKGLHRSREPKDQLQLWSPQKQSHLRTTPSAPLRVKYCARSRRFAKYIKRYIRAGTPISEGSAIYDAWHRQVRKRIELPAHQLGSSERWCYQAECLPLGSTAGTVLVLLWVPDKEFKLASWV